MKYIYLLGMVCTYLLASCVQNTATNKLSEEASHAQPIHDHEHEGHDHDHEGHDHDNEGHDHDHEGHGHEQETNAAGNPNEIIFPASKAKAVGLKTLKIQPTVFTDVIKTSGRIESAQGDERVLVATVSGVVSLTGTRFTEGTAVSKGQTVASLVTDGLAEGDVAARTRVAYEQAKSEYERAKELISDKIISQKEYNQLAAEYEKSHLAYEAVGKPTTGKGVPVAAPMNGYLKNLQVKEGDYVAVGQPLATVSQNNRLVLRAEVSEKYYSRLPFIQSANFRTPYDNQVYKLSDLNGRLLSYARSAESNSFYVPVTFEFDNKGAIMSGSYVEVWLIGSPQQNTLCVPVRALIEEQGIYSVFCQIDETCYTKQTVHVGANNGDEVQILSGIHPGDVVVTDAVYHLKLATASNAMPAHTHSH